jgi:hypothetical protein
MWRFLVCLVGLFLVACSPTQPLASNPLPVKPQVPISTPTPPVKAPSQAPSVTPSVANSSSDNVVITVNTPATITISNGNITIDKPEPPGPVATPPPVQYYITVGDISYPIAGVPPSNPDYYKFPPLTEERIRKAESVLCVRAREMDGGPCSTCDNLTAVCGKGFNSVGTGYVGGGLGIYTYYQEGGTVYELFLKDIDKPTQEILGYGEIDQNTETLR